MTVQITIVGLGQIGTSIGLALADHRDLVHRVGHDKDLSIARRAEKMGALDKVAINLPAAVRQADLVLLALPMDQIRHTLEVIALDLKEGAVVMDTGPVKEVVAGWVDELLPKERFYVGLTPVLNPLYLHSTDSGIEAAHSDLFRNGLMGIVSPQGTPSEAIKLAADLTRLLGASPFFADPLEMDGLMAGMHVVPQLLAAALLNATVDQPGWREARKIAGRAYAEATCPITYPSGAETLHQSALLNRENVLRKLDGVIAALQAIRNDLYTEDGTALEERLKRARKGREDWWKQRQAANWVGEEIPSTEMPRASDAFGRLIGIRRKTKS
jgi:prephenate dehydrogenase